MIARYREFVPRQAEMYKAAGKKFTCEDLVLQVLIDFASQNELPLKLTTIGGTVFDASDSKWNGDIMSFRDAVLSNFATKDLQVKDNTIGLSLDYLQSGDLMIQVNENGRGHHTQLIMGKNENYIFIIQGDASRKNGLSKNPSSFFGYIGGNVTFGMFSIIDGSYLNISYLTQKPSGFINEFQGRSWNYFNFNKR